MGFPIPRTPFILILPNNLTPHFLADYISLDGVDSAVPIKGNCYDSVFGV